MQGWNVWARWASVVVLLGVGGMISRTAYGVPVVDEVRQLEQPDGSQIAARIRGDEFYGVTETLDGYTIVRDPGTLFFCYARLSADGNALESTGVRISQPVPDDAGLRPHLRIAAAAAEAQAGAARARFAAQEQTVLGLRSGLRGPSTGNVQGICLLVDFSDSVGTIAAATVGNYCNQVGFSTWGNNGSVRDYYYAVSDGLLTYTNYVPTAYYRASHPRTYYTDPSVSYGQRARELITEALISLNNQGFNFSLYDADGNGVVDALNCFYAGSCPNNWAEGLWPHSSSLSYCADGVCTGAYQISDMGSSLTLYTFCHENGHMLMGWPDLYDYGGDSAGVGRFCLMCASTSSTNPGEPCAYMKYIAGWSNTTVLAVPQAGLTLPASSVNRFYKYNHPTKPNEYYLIENRQKTGRDSGLPDSGLALWHIDTQGSNDNQQMTQWQHYLVTLVQADGRWDLEHDVNTGDSTDLWAGPTYARCTPGTTPNTHWWSGSASGLFVVNISASAATMTFNFNIGADCNGNGIEDTTDIAAGTSRDCNANAVPDECEPNNDCNGNGKQDICDIAAGTSRDCQADGIPDECQLAGHDCNANGVPDVCDLAGGTSADCQSDHTPDECQLAGHDCNANAVPDECEPDCNANAIPDACDIAAGTSMDCQPNGIPDECEPDCNANRVADTCDIGAGTSADCNANAWPDECEAALCHSLWNGFQGPEFQAVMNGRDLDGDGIAWVNPANTAKIWAFGCEPGVPNDQPVQVTIYTDPPEDGYVISEYFRTNGGALYPDALRYDLRFRPRLRGHLNSKVDWQMVFYDARHGRRAVELDFASTESRRVSTEQRGRLLVRNPAATPLYFDSGVPLALDTCYELQIVLDNLEHTVQVYVDGVARPAAPVPVLDAGAVRLDYFRLQAVSNAGPVSSTTVFDLDAFELCTTGTAAAALWDCNGNGVLDVCDITAGVSQDCNSNGVPDECDLAAGTSADCEPNQVPDECEPDCNANGIPDACDLAAGTSQDCQPNGIPDSCESDCNSNGIPDACDLRDGTSPDCQANGIPDECDLAAGNGTDCNANGIPDVCDLAAGTSQDCQPNGIPDSCESDCNSNGIPDACDLRDGTSPDCQANGVPDECDLAAGNGTDCNANGIPDACDLAAGTSQDCYGVGLPAECVAADFDQNGEVDLGDYSLWVTLCYSGPGGVPVPGCEGWDLDCDSDFDLHDFALFQQLLPVR